MQQRFHSLIFFNSAPHVSDDKFAHPEEHFYNAPVGSIVPKGVYTVKNCSWGWANLSPETCRAELKWLINEKFVACCWLFTSLFLLFDCLFRPSVIRPSSGRSFFVYHTISLYHTVFIFDTKIVSQHINIS